MTAKVLVLRTPPPRPRADPWDDEPWRILRLALDERGRHHDDLLEQCNRRGVAALRAAGRWP